MTKSHMTCCIKNCKNTPTTVVGRDPPIYFYGIPPVSVFAPWKAEKRKLWLNAINKYSKYDKIGDLPSWAKICSAHFIDNKKSDHPMHPSYVPTIFPGVKPKKSFVSLARFKRYFQRRSCHQDKVKEQKKESDNKNKVEIKVESEIESKIFDTQVQTIQTNKKLQTYQATRDLVFNSELIKTENIKIESDVNTEIIIKDEICENSDLF